MRPLGTPIAAGVLAFAAFVCVPAATSPAGHSNLRVVEASPSSATSSTAAFEWQLQATQETSVPDRVLHAAASIRIAVIDTGADLSAPAFVEDHPLAHNSITNTSSVPDSNGHGTFVASLAAGALGSGGDAQLLVIKAGEANGTFTDADEAAAIVYAVKHGARIINLSFAGAGTSSTE